MRWLKKWAYLILFLGTGAGYFAFVDHWQVYAESMNRLKGWYQEIQGENQNVPGDSRIQEGDGGSRGEPSKQETDGSEGNSADPAENPENSSAGGEESGSADLPGEGGNGSAGNPESNPSGIGENDSAGNSGPPSGMGENDSAGNPGPPSGMGENGTAGNPGNPSGIGENGFAGNPESNPAGSDENGLAKDPENNMEGGTPGPVEYVTVEDDYFSDALFIGDSRTVGMFEYGGLEEVATFYASKGLTVYKMFESQIVSAPGGKITVEEALQQNTFSKIYLMIGINEMGTGTVETFLEKYREVVEHLQELQPDAIIYIQAIIKVTAERSAKGDYINNEGIEARNQGIALLADNQKVFYLDVNPLICDDTGGMNASYTFDGVHLLGKYIEIWKDYLKTHAISP